MKYVFLACIFGIALVSCKKDAKIAENELSGIEDSIIMAPDSANVLSGDAANPFQLEVLNEQPDLGKAIFSSAGKNIISFDTQANSGKIKIDGTEYQLNHLDFTENKYEIAGKGILITAENGNFQDMTSDCNYGTFPQISVKFNGKTSVFRNIKVQDCPNYN